VASILVLIVFHFGFQPLFFLQIWRVEVVVGLAWRPRRLCVDRYLSLYIYTHNTQPTLSRLSGLWFGRRPETDDGPTRDPQGPQA
jgi:hypothetical protein